MKSIENLKAKRSNVEFGGFACATPVTATLEPRTTQQVISEGDCACPRAVPISQKVAMTPIFEAPARSGQAPTINVSVAGVKI